MSLGNVCHSFTSLGNVCYNVMSLGSVCYNVTSMGSVGYSVMSLEKVCYNVMSLGMSVKCYVHGECLSQCYVPGGSVCYSVMSLGNICYNVMSLGMSVKCYVHGECLLQCNVPGEYLLQCCLWECLLQCYVPGTACYKDSNRRYARKCRIISVSYQKCTRHKYHSQVHEPPDRKLQVVAPATYLACQQEILLVLPLYC